MPALDINMIESLSRELHPPHTNLMAETEVRAYHFIIIRVIILSSYHLIISLINLSYHQTPTLHMEILSKHVSGWDSTKLTFSTRRPRSNVQLLNSHIRKLLIETVILLLMSLTVTQTLIIWALKWLFYFPWTLIKRQWMSITIIFIFFSLHLCIL